MQQNIMSGPTKILQSIRNVQFIGEFLVITKFGEKSDLLTQLLTVVQACKFYFKVVRFYEQPHLYIQNPAEIQKSLSNQQIQPQFASQIERTKHILNKIRTKPYQTQIYQQSMFEQLPSGKKIQTINSRPIPSTLKKNKLTYLQTVGELLMLIRPLISIIAIRIFGQQSYKPYLISLAIDLFLALIMQRGIKVTNQIQAKQIHNRRKEMVWRYIFRKPFYNSFKSRIVQPLFGKIINKERVISRFLLSIFDMQSSITLTL